MVIYNNINLLKECPLLNPLLYGWAIQGNELLPVRLMLPLPSCLTDTCGKVAVGDVNAVKMTLHVPNFANVLLKIVILRMLCDQLSLTLCRITNMNFQ